MASGICSMGVDVLLVGPLPTPGSRSSRTSMRADAGVVISRVATTPTRTTASSSSGATASSCPTSPRAEIEQLVLGRDRPRFDALRPTATQHRQGDRIDDASRPLRRVPEVHLPAATSRSTASPSSSTAPTAPPTTWPPRCSRSSARTSIPLGVKPDGKNINHDCGALHPESMAQAVQARRAPRPRARRRRRPRDPRRRAGPHRRRRRDHGVVGRDLHRASGRSRSGRSSPRSCRNLGLERALARAGGAQSCGPRSATATSSRRCAARLQPRRRAVGPPHLPRPRHDRRRRRCAALNVLAVMLARGARSPS